MIKKSVEKRDGFSVSIYRKKDRGAEVVFRKNKVLYRINSADDADRLTREFELAVSGLGEGRAGMVVLGSSRGRKWVFEISLVAEAAVVRVWELLPDGSSAAKFGWQGAIDNSPLC